MRLLLPLCALALVLSCATQPGPACAAADDCGEGREAPACERCPTPTTAFCLEGTCRDRGVDEVDVQATFLIARSVEGVNGLAWALAIEDRDCASFEGGLFPVDLPVLAAGQKTLSGGDLHQDVQLARVPQGPMLLLALATSAAAGEGEVLAVGCAAAAAVPPSLAFAQIDLR